jgi:hypothetical protein
MSTRKIVYGSSKEEIINQYPLLDDEEIITEQHYPYKKYFAYVEADDCMIWNDRKHYTSYYGR